MAAPATADRRVALVVGISSYVNAPRLANPINDATDIAAKLLSLGFDVTTGFDLNRDDFSRLLNDFEQKAVNADAALFYFAGHAMQYRGQNYLFPRSALLNGETSLSDQLISFADITKMYERASAAVRIIILDACRNNPLATSFYQSVGGAGRSPQRATRGLARADKSEGMLVAYATLADEVAEDGKATRNSPFTASLIEHLDEPGLEIAALFRQVQGDVMARTSNRQRPELVITLATSFYLNRDVSDAVAWSQTRDSGDAQMLRGFIAKYPRSAHLEDARFRLHVLEQRNTPFPAPPSPPAADAPSPAPAPNALEPPSQPAESVQRSSADTAAKAFRDCDQCPEMTIVPAGSFLMGSTDTEPGRRSTEWPIREVTIPRALAVGRFAVTRQEFAAFVSATGYSPTVSCHVPTETDWVARSQVSWRNPGFQQGDDHPVVCVSWSNAQAYVRWLSERTGQPYRLLTEAEREYATRAGTSTAYWWGDIARPGQANFDSRDRRSTSTSAMAAEPAAATSLVPGGTRPVQSGQPNAFGLYNVHGNAAEWVSDCWNASYAGLQSDGTAAVTGDCTKRVIRGGAWSSWPEAIRSAHRMVALGEQRYTSVGFRVARELR